MCLFSPFSGESKETWLLGQILHRGGAHRGKLVTRFSRATSSTPVLSYIHTNDARQLYLSWLSDTSLSQVASLSRTDLTRRPAYLASVSVPEPCFAADSHKRPHSPLGGGGSRDGARV